MNKKLCIAVLCIVLVILLCVAVFFVSRSFPKKQEKDLPIDIPVSIHDVSACSEVISYIVDNYSEIEKFDNEARYLSLEIDFDDARDYYYLSFDLVYSQNGILYSERYGCNSGNVLPKGIREKVKQNKYQNAINSEDLLHYLEAVDIWLSENFDMVEKDKPILIQMQNSNYSGKTETDDILVLEDNELSHKASADDISIEDVEFWWMIFSDSKYYCLLIT